MPFLFQIPSNAFPSNYTIVICTSWKGATEAQRLTMSLIPVQSSLHSHFNLTQIPSHMNLVFVMVAGCGGTPWCHRRCTSVPCWPTSSHCSMCGCTWDSETHQRHALDPGREFSVESETLKRQSHCETIAQSNYHNQQIFLTKLQKVG